MTSLLKVKGCQRLSSSSTYDRGAWSISVIPGHINPGHIFSIDKRAHTFSVWQWQEPLEQEHGQALLGAPITGWDLPKCMLHMPLNSYIDKCYIAQHILPMYNIYIYYAGNTDDISNLLVRPISQSFIAHQCPQSYIRDHEVASGKTSCERIISSTVLCARLQCRRSLLQPAPRLVCGASALCSSCHASRAAWMHLVHYSL